MHRLYKSQQEKISQFNTFQVFENLYGGQAISQPDELEQPAVHQAPLVLWTWLLVLLTIFFLAFSLHPVLSYFLKTPYPLVVINDNNLTPLLKPGQVVLSQGVISRQQVKVGDLVIFYNWHDGQKYFFVRQVKSIQGHQFVLAGFGQSQVEQTVSSRYIIGRVIGGQHPQPLPLIGKLSTIWHSIR